MAAYLIPCLLGLEKLVGDEVKKLGLQEVRVENGRILCRGTPADCARLNLNLRCGARVMLVLGEFPARSFEELFQGTRAIAWEDYLPRDAAFPVKGYAISSQLHSVPACQSIIKKAIVERLKAHYHMEQFPETGVKYQIRFSLFKDSAAVCLDTSGEGLYKRGYRAVGVTAPLRETLAAAMVQLSRYNGRDPFCDPFCGSGTIAIEAALYAHNIAPGLGRRFAYENLVIYNQQRALEIKREEASKIRTDVECRITGSDIDPAAVERSRLNAEHACVMAGRALQLIGSDMRIERPDFIQSDYKDIRAPYETGLLLCNPPYGERLLDQADAEDLYGEMKSLFVDFENWQMGVITSQKNFQECICKKASASKTLKAGNLDTTLYIYR